MEGQPIRMYNQLLCRQNGPTALISNLEVETTIEATKSPLEKVITATTVTDLSPATVIIIFSLKILFASTFHSQ